jgi:hypothetical protein
MLACGLTMGCLASAAPATSDEQASTLPRLELSALEAQYDCREIAGELVVLFHPELGALVLAAAEFPGSEEVGRLADGQAYFSYPGLRMSEQRSGGSAERSTDSKLWGVRIAGETIRASAGCHALDPALAEEAKRLRNAVEALASGRERDSGP